MHVNHVGDIFVKEYDFFVSQGGEREKWGRSWEKVEAEDIHQARVVAISLPGAKSGLFCASCGRTREACACPGGPSEKEGPRRPIRHED